MNSVTSLVKLDFSRLSLQDKLKIKELGRPLPDLNLTQSRARNSQNRTYTLRFSREIYNKNTWLCGCEVSNLLFCFPCILNYNPAATEMDRNWARIGIKDLHHLPDKIRKHDSSRGHMSSCVQLALLGKVNIMPQLPAYRKQLVEYNEQVRKNRYILKRIISCVKFCSGFELALRGHCENEESEDREIFRELVDFSAELDLTLRNHLQNDTVFKESSTIIQTDILDSMLAVCKEEIGRQIRNSDFLAIQCDDTTDVTNWCQTVLIFRYVFDGNVCENFWTFIRIHDKSTGGIEKHIKEEIDPLILETPQELFSQSYDGASGAAGGIERCIEEEIDPLILETPQKLFAQSYDGASGAAVGIEKCIEEEIDPLILETPQKLIAQSYDGASGAAGFVQIYIKNKYPCAHYIHCYAHQLNLIIQKVASQHVKLRVFFNNLSAIPVFFSSSSNRCDVLEEIVNHRLPNLGSVTSNEASGLRRALEDPEFLFWLSFFHKIMPHVDLLYNEIQSIDKDSMVLQTDIEHFETCIKNIRCETDAIQSDTEENLHSSKRRRNEDNLPRSLYTKEVCVAIITQMNDRFAYRGHLQAAELFNTESMPTFSKQFPVDLLDTVYQAYPFFDKTKLKTELEVIYSRLDFSQIIGATNFMSFLLQNNLSEAFSETMVLLKIILTTPMTTAEPERCFSTLKRIKTFLRNTMNNDSLNALAMMSINKNVVQDVEHFDDKVFEKFIGMKDRRADFTLKKYLI